MLVVVVSYMDMYKHVCLGFLIGYVVIYGHGSILVMSLECRFLDTEVDGSNPDISMLCW